MERLNRFRHDIDEQTTDSILYDMIKRDFDSRYVHKGRDLNEECYSVFFSIFPKFRYSPIGKKQEIPKFGKILKKTLQNIPR